VKVADEARWATEFGWRQVAGERRWRTESTGQKVADEARWATEFGWRQVAGKPLRGKAIRQPAVLEALRAVQQTSPGPNQAATLGGVEYLQ